LSVAIFKRTVCPDQDDELAPLETVIEAIRSGAYDYIRKPFADLDIAWMTVRRALDRRHSGKNQEAPRDAGEGGNGAVREPAALWPQNVGKRLISVEDF